MKCRIINYAVDLNYDSIDEVINRMSSEGAFIKRPVGIVDKDYYFIYNTLSRNIGNGQHKFDGYGSPISTLGEVDYNQIYGTPWFSSDKVKRSFANYIEYALGTYGPTLSFFNNDPLETQLNTTIPAVVDNFDVNGGLERIIYSNNTSKDTHTGVVNGYITAKTLKRSAYENSKRKNGGITQKLTTFYGLNKKNLENGTWNKHSVDRYVGLYATPDSLFAATTETPAQAILDFVYSDPHERVDIINYIKRELPEDEYITAVGNYGIVNDIGIYHGMLESLTKMQSSNYSENMLNNRYYPSVDLDDIQIPNNTYLSDLLNEENVGLVEDSKARYIRYNIDTILLQSPQYARHWQKAYYDGYGPEAQGGATFDGLGTNNNIFGFVPDITRGGLINQTNLNLLNSQYKTLMARFYSGPEDADPSDQTQSAYSTLYGLSRGRNLLSVAPDSSQNYTNPYCRVWTFHHQYSKYSDGIRPLRTSGGHLMTPGSLSKNTNESDWRHFRGTHKMPEGSQIDGGQRLDKYGVLDQHTGLVQITPKAGEDGVPLKQHKAQNCMLSIENLAWKDSYIRGKDFQEFGLSPEQMGPFGGRIMWFPPYEVNFSESSTADWSQEAFIGRGEKIYTYTDTERQGTLSFTMLIDHPAILNYWDRRQETDSVGDVDDVSSKEQQLLRFFAGCDILKARRLNPETREIINEQKVTEESAVETSGRTSVATLFVYFPHNYSGINDKVDGTGIVHPIYYLANGLTTQLFHNGSSGDVSDMTTFLGYKYSNNGTTIGGYEIRPNVGISIINSPTSVKEDNIVAINMPTDASEGQTQIMFIKKDGNVEVEETTKSTKAPTKKPTTGKTETKKVIKTGHKWYYRVDDSYKDIITEEKNCIDSTSYALNGKDGYTAAVSNKLFKDVTVDKLYSFADLVKVVHSDQNFDAEGTATNNDKIKELDRIIKETNITDIKIVGYAATNEATENTRNALMQDRATMIERWLRHQIGENEIKFSTSIGTVGSSSQNSNDLNTKLMRCVRIDINYSEEESTTVQEGFKEQNYTETTSAGTDNNLVGSATQPGQNTSGSLATTVTEDKPTAPNIPNSGLQIPKPPTLGESGVFNNVQVQQVATVDKQERMGITKPVIEQKKTIVHDNICRYDTEARFFNQLKDNDPVAFNKISQRIKNFDPAFHSMSPEGFHSRLTFLHQCTRQGPTIGATDNLGFKSANNMAFGRPPVCILRIGDFFYGKVIIKSVDFKYDSNNGMQWDLNPEGIGVMPMMCKVTMQVYIIGGQDLSGPVARLQNATSFNYYANTGVYDNRAEIAEYDENGNMIQFKPFEPRIK